MLDANIYNKALSLKPVEKLHLIEKLLLSLDLPNKEFEEEWSKEIESRMEAYKKGLIKTIDGEKVFEKYQL